MSGQPWNLQIGGGPGSQGSGLGYGAPVNGCKGMTSTTVYPAGRGVVIDCTTTAGNLSLAFADGTSMTINVQSNTLYQFNWAVTTYTAGTASVTVTLLI